MSLSGLGSAQRNPMCEAMKGILLSPSSAQRILNEVYNKARIKQEPKATFLILIWFRKNDCDNCLDFFETVSES